MSVDHRDLWVGDEHLRCEVSDLLLNIVGDELSKQKETETSAFTSLTGRLQVFLVPNSSKMDEDTNSDEG